MYVCDTYIYVFNSQIILSSFQNQGNPLLHHGVIVGILSMPMGCGEQQIAVMYGKVSSYMEWIQSIV